MKPRGFDEAALTRRAFGRLAVLGGGGLALPRLAGTGAADPHAASRSEAQTDAALQKLSPEGRARFESMWQSVLRNHGDRFTEDQKTRLRRIISRNVSMLEAVYAVDVRNGDGPATVLRLVDGTTPGGKNGAAPKRQPTTRKR